MKLASLLTAALGLAALTAATANAQTAASWNCTRQTSSTGSLYGNVRVCTATVLSPTTQTAPLSVDNAALGAMYFVNSAATADSVSIVAGPNLAVSASIASQQASTTPSRTLISQRGANNIVGCKSAQLAGSTNTLTCVYTEEDTTRKSNLQAF